MISRSLPPPKKWTVLIYSASDNNLYDMMQTDLDEAERVGTTDQLNVVAQTDHGPRGGGGQRLELQTNQEPGVQSPVLEELGPVNMASPETLADFVTWGQENYPAENYMLILSDHGGGWRGALSDQSARGWMSTPKIAEGLALAEERTGRKLDVLGFDACLMASSEVAHEVKDHAAFMVGSEEVEGGAGWAYNRVLSERVLGDVDRSLRERLQLSPRELAVRVVECAEGDQDNLATMSALDLARIDEVTDSVANLSAAIQGTEVDSQTLSQVANETQSFSSEFDLVDFAEKLKAAVAERDPALALAAQGVTEAVGAAVIAEQHREYYAGAHGLSIELDRRHTRKGYADLQFNQATGWKAAVEKIQY